jgi:hypothetical protein
MIVGNNLGWLNGLWKIYTKCASPFLENTTGFYGLTHSAFGLYGRLVVLLR